MAKKQMRCLFFAPQNHRKLISETQNFHCPYPVRECNITSFMSMLANAGENAATKFLEFFAARTGT
jgi:hypothetical protein